MEELFSSPGMVTALAFIVGVQTLSIFVMATVVHLYGRQRARYYAFLRTLGDEAALGRPGRFLLPVYVFCTVVLAFVTTYLFVFQPHLL